MLGCWPDLKIVYAQSALRLGTPNLLGSRPNKEKAGFSRPRASGHPLASKMGNILGFNNSVMFNADKLTNKTITELININITSIIQLIEAYSHKKQTQHHLFFVSSVAACAKACWNALHVNKRMVYHPFLALYYARYCPIGFCSL